ncbi:MAG TPA: hypothetical protein VN950_26855 [Terriglobales bacterium]|nr:hypothetical protein [Terriglobales bacterium]
MAIFTRRHLQQVLDENSEFLTPKQSEVICDLLNTPRDDYLSTEWEQVIINAASKLGIAQHEPSLGGTAKPDLFLQCNEPALEFVADIATVSDRGTRRRNPFDSLEEEFKLHLRKGNLLAAGGFNLQVDPRSLSFYRGSAEKPALKLPERKEWPQKIFSPGFRKFLKDVQAQPDCCHKYDASGPDTGVHFTYDPAKRGRLTGGHLVCEISNVLDKNPLYYALKSKGDQLKASGYGGPKGIFICDGGCHTLSSTTSHFSSYNANEIVGHFFRQYDSVLFVVCFVVQEHYTHVGHDRKRSVEAKLFLNPKWRIDTVALTEVISKVHRLLPPPQSSPGNAVARLKSDRGMQGEYFGRLTMGGSVKMSSRMLLELLSGNRTIGQFLQEYRMEPGHNPFSRALAEGRLISKVTIERQPDKDDDCAIVEFGDPDPAVVRFRTKSGK